MADMIVLEDENAVLGVLEKKPTPLLRFTEGPEDTPVFVLHGFQLRHPLTKAP